MALEHVRTEKAAAAINRLCPKSDTEGRAMLICLRTGAIVGQGMEELLAMDITPEVRAKIIDIQNELKLDKDFVNNA